MGAQMGGAKVPKTALFLIGPPLGAPGEHEATKMEPKGGKMSPREHKIEVLGSKNAPQICAPGGYQELSWVGLWDYF